MFNKRVAQLLGLAQASKNITSGEKAMDSIRHNKAKLVIIAADASENTKKRYINKCDYYGIQYIIMGSSDELSHAIGKNNRMAICVLNENFASKIIESGR